MKCVGAGWLVKLYEHLENNPHIIVNGFRHAGIFRALNILTDIGDTNLVDYSDSSSEDTMSDAKENEIIVPDNAPLLWVTDVYSDSDVYSRSMPETVILDSE